MSTHQETFEDEEDQLPCAEALLAGTLALMTGHAQACSEGQRQLMATKIVSNLSQLTEHPLLSQPFRAALCNLHVRWQRLQEQGPRPTAAGAEEHLWHAAAPALQ